MQTLEASPGRSEGPADTVEITAEVVGRLIPPRRAGSRKGANGKVLIVGGSHIYHGAPALASLAAIRSGADLVYTAVPKTCVQPVRCASPDLIVIPLADQKITRGAVRKLLGIIPKDLDSAAIGMGLAVADPAALNLLIRSLLDRDVALSLDASALTRHVLPAISGKGVVLTPHAGEFARMFGDAPPEDAASRVRLVREHAGRHGATILLKGPTDIVCGNGASYTFSKCAPCMTVGGTGDVLSGLVAGLLPRIRDAAEAAAAAAYVNGAAGLSVQARLGFHIASTDLIDSIPHIMKDFDRLS